MHYKFSVYLGFIYISQIFVLIVRVPKVWRLSIYIDRFAKRVMDTNNRNCLSSIDIADNGFMLASIYQNVFSVLYGVQIIYLIATCVSLSRKFSLVFHVKNWKNMELMYAEEDPRRAAYLKRNKRQFDRALAKEQAREEEKNNVAQRISGPGSSLISHLSIERTPRKLKEAEFPGLKARKFQKKEAKPDIEQPRNNSDMSLVMNENSPEFPRESPEPFK